MNEIKANPESYRTSIVTPIKLSETERTKTTFECKQVDNTKDIKKNIKGKLVIKKKTKDIGSFDEIEKFSKKDIASKEWVEIALNTSETYELAKGLYDRYLLFGGQTTNPYDEVKYIKEDEDVRRIIKLLETKENVLDLLEKIDIASLNSALHYENLRRAKIELEENINNNKESFWQSYFENNSWILAQLFHTPVMLFRNKRYVGGKGIDNQGGQITDLIYKNDVTDNIALIEIKEPTKRLLSGNYRQTFALSDEVSGGLNQLLKQRDTIYKHYATIRMESDEIFNANNIECILLVGNVSELDAEEQKTFDSFRNELRSVKILGFDELLKKIDAMIKIVEGDI